MRSYDALTHTLGRLGFSEIEASIYIDLLKHPGSTGYGIGKSIARPHANVYQGLNSLEQKGAVMFEDGERKTFTATPPDELLELIRRRFEEDCDAAAGGLDGLKAVESDQERFHRLLNRHQVYSRAEAMLARATETILFYGSPVPDTELRDSLSAAVERGVAVAGLVLRQEDLIEGSSLIVPRLAEKIARIYRRHQFYLVVDAREFLLGFTPSHGRGLQAVWARSELVVPIVHNGLVADSILHALPIIEQIQSPNLRLFGRLPSALNKLIEVAPADLAVAKVPLDRMEFE